MGTETDTSPSHWNVDTLKEYFTTTLNDFKGYHAELRETDALRFQERFDAQEKAFSDNLASADRAVQKAEAAAEKRFECVSADTPILCADLVWRQAGSLQVGDELIGLDEDAPTRRGRRFRRAVVTENSLQQDILYEVETTDGSVRCNADHPWLTFPEKARRAGTNWRWVITSDLKAGDQVMRAYRHTQPFTHFIITRRADVMKVLGSIRPPRLLMHSSGVWDGRPVNGSHRETFVTSVTKVGEGTIAALSTSTRTYIAGGFAMHNSVNEFRATLSDQSANLLTRKEADARLDGLGDKLSALSARLDRSEGSDKGVRDARADGHLTVGSVVAVAIGFIALLSLAVSAFSAFHQTPAPQAAAAVGLVGADTKRVDDLIAQTLAANQAMATRMDEANRVQNGRMDALSARLNTLMSSAPVH